jgi:thermitase
VPTPSKTDLNSLRFRGALTFLLAFPILFHASSGYPAVMDREISGTVKKSYAGERQTGYLGKYAQNTSKVSYATDRFIVKFKSEFEVSDTTTGIPSIDALNSKHMVRRIKRLFKETADGSLKKRLGLTKTFVLEVAQGRSISDVIRDYQRDPNVEYAEPDFIASIALTPNDTNFGDQWSLNNLGQTGGKVDADIDAPEAWDTSTGASTTIIAIVDTGVDLTHPDLASKIIAGYDFANDDADPTDDHGHGTHVAGIAAAVSNNSQGIAGICWACKIMPVKVLDSSGSGFYDWIASGIVYAADSGANVINLSLGGLFDSQLLVDAIQYAYNQGVVTVAAMGNGGDLTPNYPAVYPEVIAVGATDHNDLRALFSTFGANIDVVAPGVDILSTVPSAGCFLCDPSGYMLLSGTSMATPHVAGLAGLVWSLNPSLTRDQVYSILKHSAEDQVESLAEDTPGWDPYYGWGRINAASALSQAFTPPADPPLFQSVPESLAFYVPQGGCNTYRQPVGFENIGGGIVAWSGTADTAWLSVTPTSGSRPVFITVTVDPTGLTPGQIYSGNVIVTSAEAFNSPFYIPVTLWVLDNTVLPRYEAVLSIPYPSAVSGNYGGAAVQNSESVIAWTTLQDFSNGNDIYAQRVDATGTPLWGPEGSPTPVRVAINEQRTPKVVHDGVDGAIVIWTETQTQKSIIYAKRLNSDGSSVWPADVPIAEASAIDENSVQAIPDGVGGAIVIWREFPNSMIKARRVNPEGSLQWGSGITLGAGAYLNAVSDEAGGAFVAWSGSSTAFAQHIDNDGLLLWNAGGVAVGFGYIGIPSIVSDGSGGAITAWPTYYPDFNIYAQRLDASGQPLWGIGGRQLTTTGLSGDFMFTVSDGSGGAIVVYQDARTGNLDIYAQRVSPSGELLWAANGVPVTKRLYHDFTQPIMQAVSDGSGGLLVTWDGYSGINWDVFAQHLDGLGRALWGPDGISVSTASVSQINPSALSLDLNGALFMWIDARNTSVPDGPILVLNGDIYIQVINFASSGLQTYTLTVTKSGNGSGTVTSNPVGINCGSDCSEAYTSGTVVSIMASPSSGSTFSGWSGNADCSDGTVTMNANKNCTATFNLISPPPPPSYTLTIAKTGNGSGTVTSNPSGISCGPDCSEIYNNGTVVSLVTNPDSGSVFSGWSGDADCTDGFVTMDNSKSCTATFSLQTFTLTVTKIGPGSGTVASSPSGINCGSDCSAIYNSDTEVTLTPIPAGGSTFAGWSGNADCNDGSVTMNADKTCTATFVSSGDLDGSGRVDGFDLGRLGLAFGSHPGDSNWNPDADLNGDGIVDGSDLTILAENFGKMI